MPPRSRTPDQIVQDARRLYAQTPRKPETTFKMTRAEVRAWAKEFLDPDRVSQERAVKNAEEGRGRVYGFRVELTD